MTLAWEQVVIDSADPSALGTWWATALGWIVVTDEPDEVEVQPAPGVTPGLIFVPVPEAKAGKNRLHLDFRPAGTDADPEGNEFCVLRAAGSAHDGAPEPTG